MKIGEKVKGLVQSSKNSIAVASGVIVAGFTTAASAVGTENTVVSGAFKSMTDDLTATLTPIAIAAIAVAVVFLGFKYGRKIFNTVAK